MYFLSNIRGCEAWQNCKTGNDTAVFSTPHTWLSGKSGGKMES